MFSRIIFLMIFTCSIVNAQDSYMVGELLVLTQPTDAEQTKWIIPEGYEGEILQTRTQLATVPTQTGTMEFLFIEVGETVTYTRIFIEVHKEVPPQPVPNQSSVNKNPFDGLEKVLDRRRTPPVTNDPAPILVMYTAPFSCPSCDKWKKEVYPKLSTGGWKYAEEKTGVGINAFPSFEVRLGNKRSFHEGYLTMDQINTLLEGLK